MKNVLLVCREEDLGFFNKSVLSRGDISLTIEYDIRMAVNLAVKAAPDLLIVRERWGELPEAYLKNLARAYSRIPFPVALISDLPPSEVLPPYLTRTIPARIDIALFNDIVAEMLGLPARRTARLPIRIGLDLSTRSTAIIANTLNISSTGMLVEASYPLNPGQTYQFRFMGAMDGEEFPRLNARVLREEFSATPLASRRHYAIEFVDVETERMERLLSVLVH